MRILTLAFGCLGVCLLTSSAQAPPAKAYLLHFSQGQLPTDTGTEATKTALEEQKELGGRVLKVDLVDSFGDSIAKVKNWRPFTALRFDAFNPGSGNVKLNVNVKHRQTTNYQTRIEIPVVLKPGKNQVRLAIANMANVNGSAPDLANVDRWYIAVEDKPAMLYFGDIWLEGAGAAAPGSSGPSPLVGYHLKGKVGNLEVDLTVTPFLVSGPTPPGPAMVVGGDPARLARLKATPMPPIDRPILFHTPEADAICSALEVFPPNNPWNLVVEDWPLHPNSKNMIAAIGSEKPLRYNDDMGFVLVPPNQQKVDVKIVDYPGESDKGPFPVPDNVPIEGWPTNFTRSAKLKNLTLDDVQRDKQNHNGDRHAIVVDPVNRMLYEFYIMKKTDAGWQAAQASVFDLKTNRLRTDGWTSADAAGLPIFPAVVRYDELKRGMIEHAMRVTIRNTRRAYVYPATHFASRHTDENLPRMGERIRLRRDFDVSGFRPEIQAILKGLKKYGMLVADNGIDWAISVAPDPRIPVLHEELRMITGADFEVVVPPPGYQPPAK